MSKQFESTPFAGVLSFFARGQERAGTDFTPNLPSFSVFTYNIIDDISALVNGQLGMYAPIRAACHFKEAMLCPQSNGIKMV